MSEQSNSSDPVFIAGANDPSRAEPVSAEESDRLINELRTILYPLLEVAAKRLETIGYSLNRLEVRGNVATLMLQRDQPNAEAWMRFQVHQSFGPLLSSERIFWMTAVYRDGTMVAGTPGRFHDFDDLWALNRIISDFMVDCIP